MKGSAALVLSNDLGLDTDQIIDALLRIIRQSLGRRSQGQGVPERQVILGVGDVDSVIDGLEKHIGLRDDGVGIERGGGDGFVEGDGFRIDVVDCA